MKVAVPSAQHSKMLGQPASSQTVDELEVLRQGPLERQELVAHRRFDPQPRRLALRQPDRPLGVDAGAPQPPDPDGADATLDVALVHAREVELRIGAEARRDRACEPVGDLVPLA